MKPLEMVKHIASDEDYRKTQLWDIWECEPSVFPWKYAGREECLILEGKALVTDLTGNSLSFGEGDYVVFNKGLECEWKVISKIRKRYRIT